MPRRQKSLAQLWHDLSGKDYITPSSAEDGKPLRWHWIDSPLMTFSAVLEFTGLPKGRIESYSRRGVWDLDYHGYPPGGSGHHVLYSPRSILKLIAIDRLSEAGAWPECLKSDFAKNRKFDLILNGYRWRDYADAEHDSGSFDRTLILNDANWRYFRQHGKFPGDAWAHMPARPHEDWIQMHFDVAAFLFDTMPRLIRYFADNGVKVPS